LRGGHDELGWHNAGDRHRVALDDEDFATAGNLVEDLAGMTRQLGSGDEGA